MTDQLIFRLLRTREHLCAVLDAGGCPWVELALAVDQLVICCVPPWSVRGIQGGGHSKVPDDRQDLVQWLNGGWRCTTLWGC